MALPRDEYGMIGVLAKNHSERLELHIFGKMGALDLERLEYPLADIKFRLKISCQNARA